MLADSSSGDIGGMKSKNNGKRITSFIVIVIFIAAGVLWWHLLENTATTNWGNVKFVLVAFGLWAITVIVMGITTIAGLWLCQIINWIRGFG